MKYIGREMALARASRHAGLGAARRVGYVRGRSSLETWAVEREVGIEETGPMASGLGAREVYSTITGNGYSP